MPAEADSTAAGHRLARPYPPATQPRLQLISNAYPRGVADGLLRQGRIAILSQAQLFCPATESLVLMLDYKQIPDELLAVLLDNPHESLILVDRDGVIRYLSSATAEYYQVDAQDMLGRHILEMNPKSLLPRVIETGKAEIGQVFQMGGKERIIARVPLMGPDGQVVGAFAKLMFWQVERVRRLVRQTEVLEERLSYYQKELNSLYSSQYDLQLILGESPLIKKAKEVAAQAAGSDLSLLITGETGTGKDLFAHAVHRMSARAKEPFVKVNCGAIPSELFESELFGYEAGAFTGAQDKGKPGKFEMADGGTIFLDEVGELPLTMQVKLLRVIQEGEVERLGATTPSKLNFRVIAATNQDLANMLEKGRFRHDLYYRLNIFRLETPSLSSIRSDIPRLAYHILSGLRTGKKPVPHRISQEAMAKLTTYSWPGNVRELKNVLIRAAAAAGGAELKPSHLPQDLLDQSIEPVPPEGVELNLKEQLQQAEKAAIENALAFTQGKRAAAADLLGIHRTGLYQKMKKYGIS